MRLQQVQTLLRQAHPELRSRFGVSSISVFGSVARGDERADSDVDHIVEFDRSVTLFDLADLRRRLTEILGCNVDVGTADGLRPRAREQALREAVRVA
jgi:uncharacterized protein